MLIFQLLLLLWATGDVIWWRSADRRARRLPGSRVWRGLIGIFVASQLAYLTTFEAGAVRDRVILVRPTVWSVTAYLWHFLILPPTLLALAAGQIVRTARGKPTRSSEPPAQLPGSGTGISRRQALGAVAVALPPLVTFAVVGRATAELGRFRVARRTLYLSTLPSDLDGLTIAHVTDLHIGRFLPPGAMERVADATNALAADLVAFTGDLFDASAPGMSEGFEFLRRLDPRNGLVLIEGNHDIMEGAMKFERAMKEAGVPLLLDEQRVFRVPGRATPVQFLGITWGELKTGRELGRHGKHANTIYRDPTAVSRTASVLQVAALRAPGAFPILLAHHPHAFDPAAEIGFPLILAGHTHGGQLMLTPDIGAGPIRFRYWQGLYQKPGSQLFISNGVGNWFPLRVNAPAEIVHLTLRRQPPLA